MIDRSIPRPVLRYHGGKWVLAPWVISHFPKHRTYVEPFGGAFSVGMRKARCFSEVYNDQWNLVVNVFRVLRDRKMSQELERLLLLTPFSRSAFEEIDAECFTRISDPVERARLTIFRSFAGFGSAATNPAHNTGFRGLSQRAHSTPAHDWSRYPALIRMFHERLQGVVIENCPASELMLRQDSDSTLYYLDPPYLQSTRNLRSGSVYYEHEMSVDDHVEMLEVAKSLAGHVVLSAYRTDLYDDLLLPAGWSLSCKEASPDGRGERTECLYLNPKCTAAQRQLSFFSDSLYLK